MRWFLLCSLVVLTTCYERKSYEGYKVYEVTPKSRDEVKLLREWMLDDSWLDFWSEPSKAMDDVHIMVPPHYIEFFHDKMKRAGLSFKIHRDDLTSELNELWGTFDVDTQANLDGWNTLEQIDSIMRTLQGTDCSARGLTCSYYSIGKSVEGRDLMVLKVGKSGSGRKAHWIDATIHAREWLATGTILKIANNLVNNYGSNSDVTRLVDKYDFYIMAVMNPDGYVHSYTVDRYWRKNRSYDASYGCYGADLNRNYNFRWGTDGVSRNPCSDLYCGSSGGSEPETQAVQNEAQRLSADIISWVTIHAYGRMWMHPWGNLASNGWDCARPADHNDLFDVASVTADAIQAVYNTRWSRGNSCEVIYETSGGTDDYVKGACGIKYSFCPELRGSDFVVSTNQIEPSFRETWAGVVAMCDRIAAKEGI